MDPTEVVTSAYNFYRSTILAELLIRRLFQSGEGAGEVRNLPTATLPVTLNIYRSPPERPFVPSLDQIELASTAREDETERPPAERDT